jgi:hypothetical protein
VWLLLLRVCAELPLQQLLVLLRLLVHQVPLLLLLLLLLLLALLLSQVPLWLWPSASSHLGVPGTVEHSYCARPLLLLLLRLLPRALQQVLLLGLLLLLLLQPPRGAHVVL